MTVTAWSVGFVLTPILLNAIIAGFFGFAIAAPPLLAIIIAGTIALGLGVLFGYLRYRHLMGEAKEIASKYRLEVVEVPEKTINSETAVDIEQIYKKPSNTITLVLEENKNPVAYFKSADNERHSLDLGFISPEEQKKNEIIQRILSDQGQATYTKTNSDSDPEETLSKGQQSLLIWEKINAFFCDAPTIFALALIIIFLTTPGILIPSALLIAAIASIAYGFFSAWIKDKQCDAKLRAMGILENSYGDVVKMANTLITEVTVRADRAKLLKEYAARINPEHFEPIVSQLEKDIDALQIQVNKPYDKLLKIKKEVHVEFSAKDIWRLVYAFIFGGITMGFCIYVVLPALLTALGLAPLSLPVLLIIIGVASVIYGLCNLYNKKHMIEREKWNKMDNEAIEKIRKEIEAEKSVEENEETSVHASLRGIDKRLTQLKDDLISAERERVEAQKSTEKQAQTQQPASESDYSDSGLGSEASQKLRNFYAIMIGLLPKNKDPNVITSTDQASQGNFWPQSPSSSASTNVEANTSKQQNSLN